MQNIEQGMMNVRMQQTSADAIASGTDLLTTVIKAFYDLFRSLNTAYFL
jgi:hypothetical protein